MAQKTASRGKAGLASLELKYQEAQLRPAELLLDPGNLRLIEEYEGRLPVTAPESFSSDSLQQDLLRRLTTSEGFDVGTLSLSILSMGFLDHERLVVAPYSANRYLVLEGNRRTAAVKQIAASGTLFRLPQLSKTVEFLPCLVFEGPFIAESPESLLDYRRAATVLVGLRHLTGTKEWGPASRYEFLHQLREDGWAIEDITRVFGRDRAAILRDLRAHALYKDFVRWGTATGSRPRLKYNLFSEIARSPDITKWLGWSEGTSVYRSTGRRNNLFEFIGEVVSDDVSEGSESVEAIARKIRDALKTKDDEVIELLDEGKFISAFQLANNLSQGRSEEKIKTLNRQLKNIRLDELLNQRISIAKALDDLERTIKNIRTLMK